MAPKRKLRTRFWVESTLATVTGLLFAFTFFWHDWLEAFGFDPDSHDGSVEWLIVGGLLVLFLVFAASTRFEWRRAALAH